MEAPALSAGRSARVTPLLEVSDLTVAFEVEGKERRVVAGVSYSLPAGRTLGVVGESGCGKSMTALALMGLVPSPGKVTGSLLFEGSELLGLPESEWRKTRGARVAMVFQEPMTSLNPVMPVGKQIAEVMVLHQAIGWGPAEARGKYGRAARGGRHSFTQGALVPSPSPHQTLRRDAAACHDRDGARLPPGPPDRRRADDGARRDDPGARSST